MYTNQKLITEYVTTRFLSSYGVLIAPFLNCASTNSHIVPATPLLYLSTLQQLDDDVSRTSNKLFETIVVFSEAHGRGERDDDFYSHRTTSVVHYVIAAKKASFLAHWRSSGAQVQFAIQKLHRSKSSNNTNYCTNSEQQQQQREKQEEVVFEYFDDGTMKSYEHPSRYIENTWCHSTAAALNKGLCGDFSYDASRYSGRNPYHRMDNSVADVPSSSFYVGSSTVGDRSGRGVFTKVFIPKGSYIGMDDCVNGMFVPPNVLSLIQTIIDHYDNADDSEDGGDEDTFDDDDKEEDASASKLTNTTILRNHKRLFNYIDGYGWYDNDHVSTKS
jgi:hypothetical protein